MTVPHTWVTRAVWLERAQTRYKIIGTKRRGPGQRLPGQGERNSVCAVQGRSGHETTSGRVAPSPPPWYARRRDCPHDPQRPQSARNLRSQRGFAPYPAGLAFVYCDSHCTVHSRLGGPVGARSRRLWTPADPRGTPTRNESSRMYAKRHRQTANATSKG